MLHINSHLKVEKLETPPEIILDKAMPNIPMAINIMVTTSTVSDREKENTSTPMAIATKATSKTTSNTASANSPIKIKANTMVLIFFYDTRSMVKWR